jgi:hypothetical protein
MISDLQIAQKYINKSNAARSEGIEFDLPFISFRNVMRARKCYYSGEKLTYSKKCSRPSDITIDRVDRNKGYIAGNVVACSKKVNSVKGMLENPKNEFTGKILLKIAKKIMEAEK